VKFLWVSNAPWSHSGYGSQTRQVGRRIVADGHTIEYSANDGTRGSHEFEGSIVRGSGADRYSRDKVREDFVRSEADWAIVLYDPWVYTERMQDPFSGFRNVAGWVPVDHFPVPPSMVPWLADHTAIAMSQYGRDRLLEASAHLKADGGRGFDVFYAPHAIEPVFAPTESDVRKRLDIPDDAFLIGIVAANTGGLYYDRKGFGDMLQAAADFMTRHPDAYLYIHALHTGHEGIHLPILTQVVNIDPSHIRWVDQYDYKDAAISDAQMAELYTAFDVLLATSRGEGFGIPVLEAQACGTPAIVSNWTAQPELVGEPWNPQQPKSMRTPSGWVIAVEPDYDAKHAAFFGKPRIYDTIVALEDAYRLKGDADLKAAAIDKASGWAADKVFAEHWRPIIEQLGSERKDKAQAKRDRRAARNLAVVK
jgi:glycosyltransferase involved in cell wall biosynthesis